MSLVTTVASEMHKYEVDALSCLILTMLISPLFE